jgi:hypothetical protein
VEAQLYDKLIFICEVLVDQGIILTRRDHLGDYYEKRSLTNGLNYVRIGAVPMFYEYGAE